MNLRLLSGLNLRLVSSLLRLVGVVHPSSRRMYWKLEDIREYLKGDGLFAHFEEESESASFNGSIAYVVHSLGYFHPSGYTARTTALLNALKQGGVSVTGVVRPGYPWDIDEGAAGLSSSTLEFQGATFHVNADQTHTIRSPDSEYIASYAAWLMEVATRQHVSVIHSASNFLNGAATALAGRELGVPTIYEVRGLWHLTQAFTYPRYRDSEHFRYCEKREVDACLGVDHVIVLSEGLQQWLINRGVPGWKISVVGNAANHPTPTLELGEATRALRSAFGLQPGRRVIGYIGSVVAYEGLDKLIRLVARTAASARPYLLIAGDGAARPGLESLAQTLGLSRDVLFVGRISPEQVPAHYGLFDVSALPREDSELTRLVPPVKPFEILANGCPLVVSEPVAEAIGSTIGRPLFTVDFDKVYDVNELIDEACSSMDSMPAVPTWDQRAQDVISIYRKLG